MVVTTSPSRSARATGLSGGICCPPAQSTGPLAGSLVPAAAARGCMMTEAMCSFGANASCSASATCPAVAPSSPLTITSAGPCGVRAVSAIRIRLLQC